MPMTEREFRTPIDNLRFSELFAAADLAALQLRELYSWAQAGDETAKKIMRAAWMRYREQWESDARLTKCPDLNRGSTEGMK